MAAKRPVEPWRFYVYEVLDQDGALLYVGKGSGRRASNSRKQRGGASVMEVARFKREQDAYDYECVRIAERSPPLNVAAGGNGSRATAKRPPRKFAWQIAIERVGSRAYAAKLLLDYYNGCQLAGVPFPGDASKVEQIRRVFHG